MRRRPAALALTLALGALAAACGGGSRNRQASRPTTDPLEGSSGTPLPLRIAGLSADRALLHDLAEHLAVRWPRFRLQVTTPGLEAGLLMLLEGRTDLLLATRDPSPEERAILATRGQQVRAVPLGVDPVVVLVNGENPVDRLDLPDLVRLFRGELRSWSELKGPDLPVIPYSLAEPSPVHALLLKTAVGGRLGPPVREVEDAATLLESVRRTPGGIGLLAARRAPRPEALPAGLKVLGIATTETAPARFPTERSAAARGEYPLIRPVLLLARDQGRPRELLVLLAGPAGEQLAFELGLVSLPSRNGQRSSAWAVSPPLEPRVR